MDSFMGITCASGLLGSLIGTVLFAVVHVVGSVHARMLSTEATVLNEVESFLENHFHTLMFIGMDHAMHMSQEVEVLRGTRCPDGHPQFTISFG